MKKVLLAFAVVVWCSALPGTAFAQAPGAAEPAAAPAAPPVAAAPAATAMTDADLKAIAGPKPEDKAKGDPAGTITGTVGTQAVTWIINGTSRPTDAIARRAAISAALPCRRSWTVSTRITSTPPSSSPSIWGR